MRPVVYSNCFLVLLYLLIRGTATRVIVLSPARGARVWWMVHAMALTRNGHGIGFEHSLPDDLNPFAPWWFVGRIVGIRRGEIEQRLEESGRTVWCATKGTWTAGVLCVGIWLLLFVPWIVAWAVCPLWFNVKWGWRAWGRRCQTRFR